MMLNFQFKNAKEGVSNNVKKIMKTYLIMFLNKLSALGLCACIKRNGSSYKVFTKLI